MPGATYDSYAASALPFDITLPCYDTCFFTTRHCRRVICHYAISRTLLSLLIVCHADMPATCRHSAHAAADVAMPLKRYTRRFFQGALPDMLLCRFAAADTPVSRIRCLPRRSAATRHDTLMGPAIRRADT